jgi:hypothetical protein
MARTEAVDSSAILAMLFSLSRNVVGSDAPAAPPQIYTKAPESAPSSPPSPASATSMEDAYEAAWQEDDDLSDWDAPSETASQGEPLRAMTPDPLGTWVPDPSHMRSTQKQKRMLAYANLKASNLHRRYASAGPPSPRRSAVVPAAFQFPQLAIPACSGLAPVHDLLQPGDLVHHILLSRAQLTTDITSQQKCFTEAVVAQQSLAVILVRTDVHSTRQSTRQPTRQSTSSLAHVAMHSAAHMTVHIAAWRTLLGTMQCALGCE